MHFPRSLLFIFDSWFYVVLFFIGKTESIDQYYYHTFSKLNLIIKSICLPQVRAYTT